jgi:hypothetical protein
MTPRVHLEKVDTIPHDARVFHYDQLEDELQSLLSALVDRERGDELPDTVVTVSSGDYVKYTDYYLVTAR